MAGRERGDRIESEDLGRKARAIVANGSGVVDRSIRVLSETGLLVAG